MSEMMVRLKYGSILVGVAAASYLLLVRPAYHTRGAVLAQVQDLNARVEQAQDDYDARDLALKRYASLQRRLQQETKPIPDSGDVAGVISGISSDIRDLDLSGAKINRGKESAVGSTASSGLLIETTGRFDVVMELLRRIESLPRLVLISSLAAQNVNQKTGEVRATIGLDAYYRIAAANASASAEPRGGDGK